MTHFASILPIVAEIAEVIGGLVVVFTIVNGIRGLLRPIKVSGKVSASADDRVLINVEVRRSDGVEITSAGVSVSTKRVGKFLGFGFGEEKLSLPLPLTSSTRLSKQDGTKLVAWWPLQRVREFAADCNLTLAPPIRAYACLGDSKVIIGRRVRFPK